MYRDAFTQLLDMTDYAYMAPRHGVKRTEGVDRFAERFAAECPETLIDEKCVNGKTTADVAQRKSKRQ